MPGDQSIEAIQPILTAEPNIESPSANEPGAAKGGSLVEKVRLLLVPAAVTVYAGVTISLLGRHDWLMLGWLLLTAAIMSPIVLRWQQGARTMLRNQLDTKSPWQQRLGEPGPLLKIFSFLASVAIALGWTVLLKAAALSHGTVVVLVVVAAVTLVFSRWLVRENGTLAGRAHLQENVGDFAMFLAGLVIAIIVLSLMFALAFSAKDTYVFLSDDVNVGNFDEYAVAKAVDYNGSNAGSRIMINSVIALDTLKVAVSNEVLAALLPARAKVELFELFYLIVLVFNMLKVLPLSLGFVLLLRIFNRVWTGGSHAVPGVLSRMRS